MTIGIVGGMSPESTVIYYQTIIRRHLAERGDHDYPRIVMSSVSFGRYVKMQHDGDWAGIAKGLGEEVASVAAAGADFALLATNTMHKVVPEMSLGIPFLSVFDAVAREAQRLNVRRVGLTGTRFTMADGFYAKGLAERGIEAVTPNAADQETIHRIVYEELIRGVMLPASRAKLAEIGQELGARGAEGILLGCTEIELLMQTPAGEDAPRIPIPLLPSAALHASLAWEVATHRNVDVLSQPRG